MLIKKSSKWAVPAHITGVFQIIANNDPLLMGSRGAGFSIDNFLTTEAIVEKKQNDSISVYFNDELIDGKVTISVAKNFDSFWKDFSLKIKHHSNLPMQAGFGSSGAGALGTAFALDELFSTNLEREILGQYAHKAEVENRSGLGDVIAQMNAGAEIRVKPGAPGFGKIVSFNWPEEQKIVSFSLGKLSTKDIITNQKHIDDINSISEDLLARLITKPTVEEFVQVSYEFSLKVQLMSDSVMKIIKKLRNKSFHSSMIMIGESLFVVCFEDEIKKCIEIVTSIYPKIQYWVNNIAFKGPSIVQKENE